MADPTPNDDARDDTRTSAVAAGVLGAVFTAAALGMYGPRIAASVALGAAIGVANLLTMRAIVRALVQSPVDAVDPVDPVDEGAEDAQPPEGGPKDRDHRGAGRRGGAAWGVFAVLKILVLFGGIWFLLTKGLVAPIPLVVGYGVLPLGIAAASLWSSLRPRR